MSALAHPSARQLTIAGFCLALVLGGAFAGAALTQHDPIFRLSPPPPKDAAPGTVMPADLSEAQRLDLHRTFFTAWAALLLLIPALCSFPFRSTSANAAGFWLVFWTASFIAFAVHLYWAVFVIFHGDWSQITKTTRVSAPVIDTVLAVWWALDVLLAWSIPRENRLIRVERTIVSILAFALFVAGSAIEGEILLSRALGFSLGGAVVIAVLVSWARRSRGRALGPAP